MYAKPPTSTTYSKIMTNSKTGSSLANKAVRIILSRFRGVNLSKLPSPPLIPPHQRTIQFPAVNAETPPIQNQGTHTPSAKIVRIGVGSYQHNI